MTNRDRAMDCLNWIESATWLNGGVAAWLTVPLKEKGPPYPEVTGYLIPTLLRWGRDELAHQYANWLVKVQDKQGFWLGPDKQIHNFDTAMCLQGLRCIPGSKKIGKAIERAKGYLLEQIGPNGTMIMQPDTEYTPFYCVLANAYVGKSPKKWIESLSVNTWPWNKPERMHHILYGLEGMRILGEDVDKWLKQIKALPQPLKFWYGENWRTYMIDPRVDICANAQAAILLKDRSYLAVVEAEQQLDGGILEHPGAMRCTSWTAKYYLDAMHMCRTGQM